MTDSTDESSTPSKAIDSVILQEVATLLTSHFASDIRIKSVMRLSKPERRNLILRIVLQPPPNGVPESVIFKQSLPAKDSKDDKEIVGRFARDWAGLEFLTSLNKEISFVPRFYGGSQKHRFILCEDLGEAHISLVDALTSHDRNAAIAALTRYMQGIGQLHARSVGRTSGYQTLLQKLNPGAELWPLDCDEMLTKADKLLEKLEMPASVDLHKEMRHVFNAMKEPGPFTTFIHGDICPDNVFDDPENNAMHIIDFEWGFVGNALLDATYFRMSMPTCWCVKALPAEVTEPLEVVYRHALIKHIPAAADDALYYEATVCACAYWICILLAFGIEEILDKDYDINDPTWHDLHPNWKPEGNKRQPRVLSRLQAFIDVAESQEKLPHLKQMAEAILKALKVRWPEAMPLELFAAFKAL